MNRIELQDNDFPFTAKSVRFLQQTNAQAIEKLVRAFGDNLILWGCELVSGHRTAGAVVINGELLPFEQSPVHDRIKIVETSENVTYRGGIVLPAYFTRVVRCDSTGTINLADLRRIAQPNAVQEPTEWTRMNNENYIPPARMSDDSLFPSYRIGHTGKGQVIIEFWFIQNPPREVLPIAQLPIRPSKRSSIVVSRRHNNSIEPVGFGYVDTDGTIYIDNTNLDARNMNVGIIVSEFDL